MTLHLLADAVQEVGSKAWWQSILDFVVRVGVICGALFAIIRLALLPVVGRVIRVVAKAVWFLPSRLVFKPIGERLASAINHKFLAPISELAEARHEEVLAGQDRLRTRLDDHEVAEEESRFSERKAILDFVAKIGLARGTDVETIEQAANAYAEAHRASARRRRDDPPPETS